ncbi:hypothetical protein B0H16DRAFT_1504502 [Mycena metata]|uniref:Uncharacterized protein n=1 Tax=Mycena metata TaxID=1033252 RepID=A0AAD7K355_9AGAR|nr:hypothetical protein B0H16DRAFT_1504502 [Mycena metata]
MANLSRSAKSGSDWSVNELLAYHISVKPIQPDMFSGTLVANPSLADLDPKILTAADPDDPDLSDSTARYLGYLDLASNATQESLIDDFARETLHLLGFSEHRLILSTRYIIPLTICGETQRTAQADVCLLHRRTLILLVLVEDKTLSNPTDAQSEVIAEAISAFQFNNMKRESLGCAPLPSMTIPCITMSGTRPTFYLVPVTLELSNAIATAQYPSSETVVLKCVTVMAHTRQARDEGHAVL